MDLRVRYRTQSIFERHHGRFPKLQRRYALGQPVPEYHDLWRDSRLPPEVPTLTRERFRPGPSTFSMLGGAATCKAWWNVNREVIETEISFARGGFLNHSF